MKKFKEISEEKATPEERAKLSLKHAQEKEKLVQTHKAEKERLSQQEEVGTRQSGPITLSKERKAKLVKVFDSLKVGDTVKIKFKRGGFEKQIPIRKKEVLRTRNRGWTRITFGDGVYLYKDPEEGRVVYAHGRMPSEVMDMIKESLDEAMKPSQVRSAISKVKKGLMRKWKQKGGYENFGQKELSQMKDKFDYNPYGSSDEKQISKMLDGFDNWAMNYDGNMREEKAGFSDAQLQKMKKSFSTLKRIDPSSQNYKKLKTKISELGVDKLEQIARAKIRFVSMIAAGEYAKKSGKRLHARDYMESTELEENVKISFHSKGAKTKWMKKQAVASKEIIKQTPTSVELPSRWKDLSKKKDHDEIFSVVVERKLTDAEMDKREKVAKAIEKDSPDMPMGKKMAIATNVAKGVQMENDEYDNEGGMALSQLRTAKSAVEDLMASIKEMDNLPEWVQSKLTKAVDYMDSVRDYMASEDAEEYVEEVELGEKYDSDKFFSGKGTPEQRLQLLKLQNKALRTLAHSPKQNAIKKEINALRKEMGMKVTKEEVELDESMARARADARRHMGGRGAQRGMAPLKKDVDNDATDGDRKAASKHIIQQLRKAADLPNGADVIFPSGTKKVDRRTAQQMLVKFNSLKKSFEKDKFQKSIKSLADVKKILGR